MTESAERSVKQRAAFETKYARFIPYYSYFFDPQNTDRNSTKFHRARRMVEDVEDCDPRLHNILLRLITPIDNRLTDLEEKARKDRHRLLVQTFINLAMYNQFLEGLGLDVMWTAVAKDMLEESQAKEGFNFQGKWIVRDTIPDPDPMWVRAAAGPETVDQTEVQELEGKIAQLVESLPIRQRNKYHKNPEKYHCRYPF